MIPFQNALNAFLIIFNLLPLPVKTFIVVVFIFFIVLGAVRLFLGSS